MVHNVTSPDSETLEQIEKLLANARFLSAWELAKPFAPLKNWPGCATRTIAARLASGLGDSRLRDAIYLVNERDHPRSDEAFFRAAFCRISQNGPLEVLERVESRLDSASEMRASTKADLLALKGSLMARLRDFDNAHSAADEALSMFPDQCWLHVERSIILEYEDRYDEALETARKAHAIAPNSTSAVSQLVDCLIHCQLDAEAVRLLEECHARGDAAAFAARLVTMFSEQEDYQTALHYLDEFISRSPLLDRDGKRWANRRRADLLYLAGDYQGCLEHCDREKRGFHTIIAKNMRREGAMARKRRRLDVPFIRQHNMTCAPATLASLATYWSFEFDHLEIADAICYDGTPWHKERAWGEASGFCAREFRLTREILIALIDRGIPFTLTTEGVAGAHLQACIGYDDRQGTVLLRDPTERHYGETILQSLLDDHPVQGPRCMLLLPAEESTKIDDLLLPDKEVYDAVHQIAVALDGHNRDCARSILDAMPKDHPLTVWSQYRLASYDSNPVGQFHAIDALAKRFPENAPLRYTLLRILQKLSDPGRQRNLLEAELRRKDCDPVFYSEFGEFLLRDARQLERANTFLRKAVRLRNRTGRVYASLAACRWKQRRFEDAARYRRYASCLESAWEPYAAAYAEACRVISQPEEGIRFLQGRVTRLGQKCGGPWRTLAEELDTQRKVSEASAVLDRAVAARPDDGSLILASGRLLIYWGQKSRGEALMAKATGKVHEAEWLRETARMAAFQGNRLAAIQHWRDLLALEPFAIDAHRALARLIAEEEGTRAAIQFLENATVANPRLPSLWSLRAEWEEELGPRPAIRSLEELLSARSGFGLVHSRTRDPAIIERRKRGSAGGGATGDSHGSKLARLPRHAGKGIGKTVAYRGSAGGVPERHPPGRRLHLRK